MTLARKPAFLIALLLALDAGLLAWEAWRLGFTFDEPSHMAAGYMYWTGNDVLYPSDTPPLTRMLTGWAARLVAKPPGRRFENAYDMGIAMLQGDRAYIQRVIFFSRLPFALFPLGLVFVVWHWARRIFHEGTALALAACAAFEPTILGHGALIKSDVPAAFACVLFAYAAWIYWQRPGGRRLLPLVGALLAAALTKFSLLALLPVAMLILLWRGPRLVGPALALGVLYAGIAAAYQFRFSAELRGPVENPSTAFASGLQIPVEAVLTRLPFPPQFSRGIRFIGRRDSLGGFGGYMLGRVLQQPSPWYFPLAWAIKFPIALQLAAVAGLIACLRRPRRPEAAIVWGIALWLALLACRSSIQIGFRHMLPALPLLILGGGFALERWKPRVTAWLLAACVAGESLWVYPNGISYFNEWIGGPKNGWKYLADSNIDWGQNLPELMDYIRRHNLQQVHLTVATLDPAVRYENWQALVEEPYPFGDSWTGPTHWIARPGVYAIAANVLVGMGAAPKDRDYFAALREREPDARAGYSILIYAIPAANGAVLEGVN
jgi:4-amino-4-deoxy-L-arabinose transferase-like glycosyltransferase